MKKILLTTLCLIAISFTNAQTIIDTVSIGAGYANQKWYSLQNDEQGSAPKNNWDIAFDPSGFGTSIHINSVIGTMLWTYPSADTTGWATIDTTGINSWVPKYNSDTSWVIGAFDKGAVTSNANDVGWGIYNSITHIITGDSLFVIKLSNGSYKKLWIINSTGTGYNFKYADLNGSNLQTKFISKSAYANKIFGYYSLQTNTALDREPVTTANWDLLFTQYTAFVPTPYTVGGVLSNKGVRVAQADNVSNPVTFNNWFGQPYKTAINEIGYDWKAFTTSWLIAQDTVYFVKSKTGDIWKMRFTGFGGSSNGNYIFSKEKLSTVGINENNEVKASVSIYPNPSNSSNVTVLYDLEKNYSNAQLNIFDITGKLITQENLNNTIGFYSHTINTQNLKAGVYVVSIKLNNTTIQQKLIVN
ncbi:MAG: T9SS type A sorting domain-containing protein [Bacteroidetes bacterium]|nr:T9SS type A sorting domain-containing protein [Bacteroidota bacterium]